MMIEQIIGEKSDQFFAFVARCRANGVLALDIDGVKLNLAPEQGIGGGVPPMPIKPPADDALDVALRMKAQKQADDARKANEGG